MDVVFTDKETRSRGGSTLYGGGARVPANFRKNYMCISILKNW